MKSLFKYVALETFPICLGFSPTREGASSFVRNRVPSAETSLQNSGPAGEPHARPGAARRIAGTPQRHQLYLGGLLRITGCSGSGLSQPGHLRQAVLPSLYMIIGCVTGKSGAKELISHFSNTAQLKVYQLPGKPGFPSISVATVT